MRAVDLRKELHRLAEPSGQEEKTASFVASRLRDIGFNEIHERLGGWGLLAFQRSGQQGPFVLFRAELDALPIDDPGDWPHRSRTRGVGHKCGHDGHMALLLELAAHCAEHPVKQGEVGLLFQPAEETGLGAGQMLDDPGAASLIASDREPDHMFALHNIPGEPLGAVLMREGTFASASIGLEVTLTGHTAHAAHPEQARSPADALASLITGWHGLVRTHIPFDRPALLTVVHAALGRRAFGTTPGEASLAATLRAHENHDLDQLAARAVDMAESIASRWQLDFQYEFTESFRAVKNHPASIDVMKKAAARCDGLDVRMLEKPYSWSEDFGRFTDRFPGALIGLGAGTDTAPLHHPDYDFPDALLKTGPELLRAVLQELDMI